MNDMMLAYFDDLVTGIETKIRDDPSSRSHRKIFALELARLGSRLYDPSSRVAWCGVAAPFDVLNALGLTSCFVEFVGATLSTSGTIPAFLEKAEEEGFAPDMCAYHRGVVGAALEGLMPVPDVLIATSCPCTAGVATIENLARIFDRDLFVLHVPQTPSRDNVRYLADQLRDMVAFVTDHTGEPLDDDALRSALALTNQARSLLCEVYALAQHVPSPASSRDLRDFGIALPLLFGTQAAVDVAEIFRQTFEKRVASGTSGVPDERARLLWVQNRIQFRNPVIEMLERGFSASIVVDELNTINWDPIDVDDPWTDIAVRTIAIPLNGPIENRTRHLRKLARDYRIHGAINPCNWGCRQGAGARGLIQAGLDAVGVPVLNLEVDCVDPRAFSEGQVRTRLEAFLEMIENRPSPWS